MNAWIRLGLLGFVIAALVGVALVAARESRTRANLAHCRRNGQELARTFTQEFQFNALNFDPTRTGRAFWHELRFISRRLNRDIDVKGLEDPEVSAEACREIPCPWPKQHRHEWKPYIQGADPYVCPVFAKTRTDPEDPAAIDYRGPKAVPRGIEGHAVIGADRPGNHPDGGGFVLFSDGAVEYAGPDSSPWKAAAGALTD